MKIISTNKLNDKEIKDIEKLLKKVHEFDQTYRDPYLSNEFNFDKDMPCFYLAYNKSNDLLGILTVYADNKDVEIILLVDPDYRRKKIAPNLYGSFLKETKEYNLNEISFITEEVFLNNNPDLINNLDLIKTDYDEYQLSRKHNKENIDNILSKNNNIDLIFEKASIKDVSELTKLTHEAFDTPIDITKRYNLESIKSNTSDIYILRNKKDIISKVSIDYSSDQNYFYSVATKKEYLRQGYAYILLLKTIRELEKQNNKDFQIGVNSKNTKAKNLYLKLGFNIDTKIIYLDTKNKENIFK